MGPALGPDRAPLEDHLLAGGTVDMTRSLIRYGAQGRPPAVRTTFGMAGGFLMTCIST